MSPSFQNNWAETVCSPMVLCKRKNQIDAIPRDC
jgi:hypothetical protein